MSKLPQQPEQQQQQQQPRDGPSTVFEADPKVVDIFTTKDGDYFGLVLVTGWRFNPVVMDPPYNKFLTAVKGCFDESDLVVQHAQVAADTAAAAATVTYSSKEYSGDNIDDAVEPPPPATAAEAAQTASPASQASSSMPTLPPAVYLYPSCHLHITLATFAPPERKKKDGMTKADYEGFIADYVSLVQEASRRPNWPTGPIELVVESTQLGSKAGILLWKDISGGVTKIRQCLQETSLQRRMNICAVPGIIHSTFLRFSKCPATLGGTIQERYQTNVVPQVRTIFGTTPFTTNSVKLAIESSPYMHIPDDQDHVALTIPLQ